MARKVALVFVTIALLLAACGQAQGQTGAESSQAGTTGEVTGKEVAVPGGSYRDITSQELHTMLETKDFQFINVHIPFEGDIAGTDDSIPYNEVSQNLDRLPGKDEKIVLYCRSDRMSRIAAEELVGLGYTNVWNLDGGMVAWEGAGYTLEGK